MTYNVWINKSGASMIKDIFTAFQFVGTLFLGISVLRIGNKDLVKGIQPAFLIHESETYISVEYHKNYLGTKLLAIIGIVYVLIGLFLTYSDKGNGYVVCFIIYSIILFIGTLTLVRLMVWYKFRGIMMYSRVNQSFINAGSIGIELSDEDLDKYKSDFYKDKRYTLKKAERKFSSIKSLFADKIANLFELFVYLGKLLKIDFNKSPNSQKNLKSRLTSFSVKNNKFYNILWLPLKYIIIAIFIVVVSTILKIDMKIMLAIQLTLYTVYFSELLFTNRHNESSNENLVPVIAEFIVFSLIAAPLIVYSFTIFAAFLPEYFPRVGTVESWIGFAGSIIGGTMTIFALAFSISYSSKQIKTQRNNDVRPILHLDIHKIDGNRVLVNGDEEGYYIELELSCHSVFPAYNLEIKSILLEHIIDQNVIKVDVTDSVLFSTSMFRSENIQLISYYLASEQDLIVNSNLFGSSISIGIEMTYTNIDNSECFKRNFDYKLTEIERKRLYKVNLVY